ncbi:response regulator [Kiloniella spongiae]|uniref:response regulator n=1 Tax=Kiloniella spongiae TaxID=1489064 RepID=UPI00069C5675|nr:response regulator [Kiloniella spongiae]
MVSVVETTTVLVIDDSMDDRELCLRSLKRITDTNYRTVESSDGDEGIEFINQFPPDCVLLDYSMPKRNGLEILKIIHDKHPHLPVIMLTGQGDEIVAVEVMKNGAQDYLTKDTINAEVLNRVIKHAIERASLAKEVALQRDSLTTFSHALAHDLKEPVRMIRSFLQLIDTTQDLTSQNQEYFSHVITATNNMDHLIDMVRCYTKLDAPDDYYEKEPISLANVIKRAQSNLKRILKDDTITIVNEENLSVNGNETQLMQLFQNLLMNAIVHNDKKSPKITISIKEEFEFATVFVTDNGPGIPLEYAERIFEPFARFSEEKKGTGLGLAICKKTIERHGGLLWYEQSDKGGSVFKFTLQMNGRSKDKTLVNKHNKLISTEKNLDETALANVLLVEDDDLDIRLTQALLFERDGLSCQLHLARNGAEALTFLKSSENPAIDLILLDINMPIMDGFEFLQNLRKDEQIKSLPIIMCTTSNDDRDIRKAKSFDVLDYLNKPITLDKMRPCLNSYTKLDLEEKDGQTHLWRH